MVERGVGPNSQQFFFSEKLVQVPCSFQVNDRRRELAHAGTSQRDWGLPAEGIVLCNFNNSYKISPAIFEIWMRLLRSVPGSLMWLLETNDLVKDNLRLEAGKRGGEAGRLSFAPTVSPAEHRVRDRHAELFLDTRPCNAH